MHIALRILSLVQICMSLSFLDDAPEFYPPTPESWRDKYGPQIDQPFSGPLSFAHLPYVRCLDDHGRTLDVAILGIPFDTAVSYRPGARFGPHAIRAGSRRQRALRGYTLGWGINPYTVGLEVIDCGMLLLGINTMNRN
jgi:agmatinase